MLLFAVAVAAVGAFTYLQRTEPAWWARIWYPLRYQAIVRGHAAHYRLNPALLAAVIEQESKFKADARSSTGAIGLMQLQPATAKGIALHTGGHNFVLVGSRRSRRSTCATARGTCGTCSTSTTTSGSPSRRTTPARRTSTSGARRGEDIQFSETRAYVSRVERLKGIYRRAYGVGARASNGPVRPTG